MAFCDDFAVSHVRKHCENKIRKQIFAIGNLFVSNEVVGLWLAFIQLLGPRMQVFYLHKQSSALVEWFEACDVSVRFELCLALC